VEAGEADDALSSYDPYGTGLYRGINVSTSSRQVEVNDPPPSSPPPTLSSYVQ
jgi:hypothetical protein